MTDDGSFLATDTNETIILTRSKDGVGLLSISRCQAMNAARIHDKQKVKLFWEQWIVQHSKHMDEEENRTRSSALARSAAELLTLSL